MPSVTVDLLDAMLSPAPGQPPEALFRSIPLPQRVREVASLLQQLSSSPDAAATDAARCQLAAILLRKDLAVLGGSASLSGVSRGECVRLLGEVAEPLVGLFVRAPSPRGRAPARRQIGHALAELCGSLSLLSPEHGKEWMASVLGRLEPGVSASRCCATSDPWTRPRPWPRPRPPWTHPRPRPRPPWTQPRPRPRPPWTQPRPRPRPPWTQPRPRPRLPWTQPRPRPRPPWTQPTPRPRLPWTQPTPRPGPPQTQPRPHPRWSWTEARPRPRPPWTSLVGSAASGTHKHPDGTYAPCCLVDREGGVRQRRPRPRGDGRRRRARNGGGRPRPGSERRRVPEGGGRPSRSHPGEGVVRQGQGDRGGGRIRNGPRGPHPQRTQAGTKVASMAAKGVDEVAAPVAEGVDEVSRPRRPRAWTRSRPRRLNA